MDKKKNHLKGALSGASEAAFRSRQGGRNLYNSPSTQFSFTYLCASVSLWLIFDLGDCHGYRD